MEIKASGTRSALKLPLLCNLFLHVSSFSRHHDRLLLSHPHPHPPPAHHNRTMTDPFTNGTSQRLCDILHTARSTSASMPSAQTSQSHLAKLPAELLHKIIYHLHQRHSNHLTCIRSHSQHLVNLIEAYPELAEDVRVVIREMARQDLHGRQHDMESWNCMLFRISFVRALGAAMASVVVI